jgi:hypothetical protein
MKPRRAELLDELVALNSALARRGANPIITPGEAAHLPADNLAALVAATADRVVTVARALAGVP